MSFLVFEKVRREARKSWCPRSRITALAVALFGLIPFLASGRPLLAQSQYCDVAAALNEVERQGCLSKEQRAKLAGWLDQLPEQEKAEALKSATSCYQCLLRKKVAADKYSCFRQVLQTRLYAKVPSEHLCLRERLSSALIRLQQTNPAKVDMAVVDRALNDFLAGYSACRTVRQNPDLDTSVELAKDWCLDPNAPWPPLEFTREFIEILVRVAAVNPDQGRHLGAVLGAVLRDARSPGIGTQNARELADAYRLLIEQDRENLAGTSILYLFRQELAQKVPRPDWAEPAQISALLQASQSLHEQLEAGARRLQDRASAWRPYEYYSDLLNDLAEQLRLSPSQRKMREELLQLSCKELRRGLEVSEGQQAQDLIRIRENLLNRVRSYGLELGHAKRYLEVIHFESEFLDPSSKTLLENQQCYIHAHLAQAFYALGDYRNAMEHFEKSCGISLKDLEALKK
jgi:hypothetical protein